MRSILIFPTAQNEGSMAMKSFQLHLSDALLMALIPALGATVVNRLGLMRSAPECVYLIAVVSILPGAATALAYGRLERLGGIHRPLTVGFLLLLSLTMGFMCALPMETRIWEQRVASRQTAAAASCIVYSGPEGLDDIYDRSAWDDELVLEYAKSLRPRDESME
jgi:hypothetical protein